jgi:hypothetical protein
MRFIREIYEMQSYNDKLSQLKQTLMQELEQYDAKLRELKSKEYDSKSQENFCEGWRSCLAHVLVLLE